MDILDNLLRIQKQIKVSRTEAAVDAIMVSRAFFAPPRGGVYRFEYQDQWYVVVNYFDFDQIKRELLEIRPAATLVGWPPLLGIPVIEDDELLAKMLGEVLRKCWN